MKNVSDLELAVQCVKEQRQEDFGTPPKLGLCSNQLQSNLPT